MYYDLEEKKHKVKKKYHNVGEVPKSNRKCQKQSQNPHPNTHTHDIILVEVL